ncbi:Flp family type IVb pilin, partial [Streptococcus suis]
ACAACVAAMLTASLWSAAAIATAMVQDAAFVALIAALIAVGIIGAARSLGNQLSATFSNVATAMQNA